jgi:hypothetical protein
MSISPGELNEGVFKERRRDDECGHESGEPRLCEIISMEQREKERERERKVFLHRNCRTNRERVANRRHSRN